MIRWANLMLSLDRRMSAAEVAEVLPIVAEAATEVLIGPVVGLRLRTYGIYPGGPPRRPRSWPDVFAQIPNTVGGSRDLVPPRDGIERLELVFSRRDPMTDPPVGCGN